MNNIEHTIILLAENYCKKKNLNINADSRFKEDLSFDSLSLTEFIIACEDEFGIEIDLDDPRASKVKKIKDLAETIEILLP